MSADPRRRAGVEAARRKHIEIYGYEPFSSELKIVEAAITAALASDWEQRPAYERPTEDQLAWPLLNGTWPVDTPSRVLGEEEGNDDGGQESQAGREASAG